MTGEEQAMLLMLTDDKLVDSMRAFVTATNRVQHVSSQTHLDLRNLEEATSAQQAAATALQEALVQRGWRRPGA
jgi:hypothetical protein